MSLEQAAARFERIIRPQAGAVLERGAAIGVFHIADVETTLTMCIAGAFEVLRGVLDARLGPGADVICAEMILRMAGVSAEEASRAVGSVRHGTA